MARSIEAYALVKAAIQKRREQEALVVLMKAVEKLARLVNQQAGDANAAAHEALGGGINGEGYVPHFVIVDGQTWVVNPYGVAPVGVEVL